MFEWVLTLEKKERDKYLKTSSWWNKESFILLSWQLFQADAKRKRKAPILEKQSKFKAEEERKAHLVSELKRIRDEEALELREQRRRSVACIDDGVDVQTLRE